MALICHLILKNYVTKGSSKGRKGWKGWEPLKVSHHRVKFDDRKHYGIGDIMVLICHVISKDDAIKASCDIMGRGPTCKVW